MTSLSREPSNQKTSARIAKREFRSVFFYSLAGASGVLFDFIIFLVFLSAGASAFSANAVGYVSGTALSFTLNSRFVFHVPQFELKRLLSFFIVAIVSAILSSLVLAALVDSSSFNILILKTVVMLPFLAAQYVLNRLITFRGV